MAEMLGWTAPDGISCARLRVCRNHSQEEPSGDDY
jgi:hypothetical protein